MVRSHLDSCSVWSPYKKGLITDIENVQSGQQNLFVLFETFHMRPDPKHLQLPTLKYHRLRGDIIEVFKILNGFYDASVVPPLMRYFDTLKRDNDFKLKVERCNYDIRKYSFCNRVINVWNLLPDVVVKWSSLNIFKNNLDKH